MGRIRCSLVSVFIVPLSSCLKRLTFAHGRDSLGWPQLQIIEQHIAELFPAILVRMKRLTRVQIAEIQKQFSVLVSTAHRLFNQPLQDLWPRRKHLGSGLFPVLTLSLERHFHISNLPPTPAPCRVSGDFPLYGSPSARPFLRHAIPPVPNAKKTKRLPSLVATLSSSCQFQPTMLSARCQIEIAKSSVPMLSIRHPVAFFHLVLRLAEWSAIARHRAPWLDDFLSLSYRNQHRDLLDSPIESILRSRYSIKMWVSESIASPYLRTMVLRLTRKCPAASPCVYS